MIVVVAVRFVMIVFVIVLLLHLLVNLFSAEYCSNAGGGGKGFVLYLAQLHKASLFWNKIPKFLPTKHKMQSR